MMTTPALAVENLSFRYRDRQSTAIRGISFEANKGEVLLIAGASGCGKTTLIRCINGLVPRSYKGEMTGQVRIFGEDTQEWKLSQISQKIGTVLQDPERQILGTKVVSEVAFGLENLSVPREEIIQRADEALKFLKIFHLRDRETFTLSGGEKQKVALAGVLAMKAVDPLVVGGWQGKGLGGQKPKGYWRVASWVIYRTTIIRETIYRS